MSIRHNVRYGVHSAGSGQGSVPWQIPVQAVTNICVSKRTGSFFITSVTVNFPTCVPWC